MKKNIFIFVILTLNFEFLTLNCFTQPNGGFENWTSEFNFENPQGWQTLNFLSLLTPPNPLSAFKAMGIDKHSGNFALRLKTIYLNNNPWNAQLGDSTGGAFTGKINVSPFAYKFGVAYTGRPEKLEFWCKYAPVDNDTALAAVFLHKWNGSFHDTIAYGEIYILTTPTYSLLQVNLAYNSVEQPDSASIFFLPSKDRYVARVNSTLYIDDVALTGWVGIAQPDLYKSKVEVFPNPAKDNLTINVHIDEAENVKVMDTFGKLIGIYKIQNYTSKVNTSLLAPSSYFYEIQDKKDRTLTKGKFTIVK